MSVYEICKNKMRYQAKAAVGVALWDYNIIHKICDTHTHIQDSLTIVLSRLFKVYSRKTI